MTENSTRTNARADEPGPDPIDAAELSRAMARIAERSQRVFAEFLSHGAESGAMASPDPFHVGAAFLETAARMMSDPARLVEANLGLWNDYMTLWQHTAQRLLGEAAPPVTEPEKGDRRFKDELWQDNEIFDFVKQSYLLSAHWIQNLVGGVSGMDEHTKRKVAFYTRQFVDAVAPSNFVMTNPEVLRATIESGGENLVRGLDHLLDDLERGKGRLAIRMTDEDAFRVGGNIAVTPGKVIFRNALMELIQYAPATDTVLEAPLLIVPPWINKYYILDLRPKNSFIKWAVAQGHTVFVISWVNPDWELADKSFGDYMTEGPLAALDAIARATGQTHVNAIGYCLGGTLLVSLLAIMAAKGDDRILSATLFTTMTDFSEPGELGVYIDEEQIAQLEKKMGEHGYLDGRDMAMSFNMLRANDLIWSFVVNNYLLGKEPFPFDLLYWNSDSTRMPAAMHGYYLRHMYLENRLIEPGGIELEGEPVDITRIKTPLYMLSTREDHIAPWKSTFALTRMVAGPVRYVLAASGHIAGVINPPEAEKYCFWTNGRKVKDPDAWLAGARQQPGSWWPDWHKWASRHGGKRVPARIPGEGGLPALDDAPGRYVKVRLV